ncbi:MAG TPA: hypothetical protein DHV30_08950, partial [Balneola sp.]|nr:hypothetical protein [Balneola sp.]
MVLASSNSIGFKEAITVTCGVGFLLITLHFYFGLIGIFGALAFGIAMLLFHIFQPIKGSFLLVYFVASIFILDTREGIQLLELPFFGLSVILLLFVAFKTITGTLKLENALDYFFLLLHFLVPYALVIGKL